MIEWLKSSLLQSNEVKSVIKILIDWRKKTHFNPMGGFFFVNWCEKILTSYNTLKPDSFGKLEMIHKLKWRGAKKIEVF